MHEFVHPEKGAIFFAAFCFVDDILYYPYLPVPYIFGTKLPVANKSGNDRPLVPNIGDWKMRVSFLGEILYK